ncbi:MAG: hypothetical protein L0I76_15320 [Pseudonocardia sp.]|nr:hypothetical protein [Pseudonocardia sp.]
MADTGDKRIVRASRAPLIALVQLVLSALVVVSLLLPLSDLARGMTVAALVVAVLVLQLATLRRWRRDGLLQPGVVRWGNGAAGFWGVFTGLMFLTPVGSLGPTESVQQGLLATALFAVIMWFVDGPTRRRHHTRRDSPARGTTWSERIGR